MTASEPWFDAREAALAEWCELAELEIDDEAPHVEAFRAGYDAAQVQNRQEGEA